MTITYPITAPTTRKLTGITIRDMTASAASRSPFTLSSQTQIFDGQAWSLDVNLPLMRRNEGGAAWAAFILRLNGSEGTFLMGDPVGAVGRGALTGAPLVRGAGQSGQTIVIDGVPPNTTNWIREDDYLQFGTGATARLHKAILDANSDGAGIVTVDIWPRLRESPADNSAVVVTNCVGRWRRPPGEQSPGWSIEAPDYYAIQFTAIEDL